MSTVDQTPQPAEQEPLTARQLADKYGGIWGRHPLYHVEDWQTEVSNDDTRAGYWDWVVGQIEINA